MSYNKKPNIFIRFREWCKALPARTMDFWEYCSEEVWNDTRTTWRVNMIKTINLAVKSFMDSELQNRASSLTYNTLLAIVPALAMLFAIGRGFGFQNLLTSQLFNFLPSQQKALETALKFVDSYLNQASQGIFVGVGLVFLLWTLISLMGNIEDTFNRVWGVTTDRTFMRKVIDYTAILFLLPILMICAGGLSVFMSSTSLNAPILKIFSPALTVLLDLAPFLLMWISFTGMYMLFPNTKVKFKNALLSGIFAGTGFQILQYLFVSGQLYVSKYNAIYGSFAFLPLLLIWLQLVWTIALAGVVLCYSSQNIFQFSFNGDINRMSHEYRRKIALAIMTLIVKRFSEGRPPLAVTDFAAHYRMPVRIVSELLAEMVAAGLVNRVDMGDHDETVAYQPALDIHELTIGYVDSRLDSFGRAAFIPGFHTCFAPLIDAVDEINRLATEAGDKTLLMDLNIAGTPERTNEENHL